MVFPIERETHHWNAEDERIRHLGLLMVARSAYKALISSKERAALFQDGFPATKRVLSSDSRFPALTVQLFLEMAYHSELRMPS
jgi:hypothetical protein